MGTVRLIKNTCGVKTADTSAYSVEQSRRVRAFHESFPGYARTPLVNLGKLAKTLGVGGIYIKDEDYRFDLHAFKVLGGSYAIGSLLAEKLGEDISSLPYNRLVGEEVSQKLGDITFITATDGNHGRGVAWTANRLGRRSRVYMPKGTAPERLENILKLGSDASITELCYDDAVRLAGKDAEENGWMLVQDTSLPGYEKVPKLIMQGYLTLFSEAAEQLEDVIPTHVFLQAGVGSMAAAGAAYFADRYGKNKPIITIVEPHTADCIFRTAAANDGALHASEGEMRTIMAGLACGEPCGPAWELLGSCAEFFGTMDDSAAANAMNTLAHPVEGDSIIVSGESGASGFGYALEILNGEGHEKEREMLGLDENSVILCISTEGATDRENYFKITGNRV